MKIIGISGKMGVGKTTVATSMLTSMPKWTKRAFGDALKEEVSEKFGFGESLVYHDKNQIVSMSEFFYARPPRRLMSIREVLQWWGTEVRRAENQNYWNHKIANWMHANQLKYDGVIIDDVRFRDEAQFIKDNNGMLIRIEPYPDYEMDHRISTHRSESELDGYVEWDMVFIPDFGDLQFVADTVMKEIKNGKK